MAAQTIATYREPILQQWLQQLAVTGSLLAKGRVAADELKSQAREFFAEFMAALAQSGDSTAPARCRFRPAPPRPRRSAPGGGNR